MWNFWLGVWLTQGDSSAKHSMILELAQEYRTLSGRQNELFADRLMGTESAGGTLRNVRTREKLEVK